MTCLTFLCSFLLVHGCKFREVFYYHLNLLVSLLFTVSCFTIFLTPWSWVYMALAPLSVSNISVCATDLTCKCKLYIIAKLHFFNQIFCTVVPCHMTGHRDLINLAVWVLSWESFDAFFQLSINVGICGFLISDWSIRFWWSCPLTIRPFVNLIRTN